MTAPSSEETGPRKEPSTTPAPRRPFWLRHWRGLSWVFAFGLLWIVALQNLEETRIDVLFWSFPAVPKLVLLLGAMGLGAALWEIGRRILKGL